MKKNWKTGVDPKCVDLAKHFLSDKEAVEPKDITELAETIQLAVELWFFEVRWGAKPK